MSKRKTGNRDLERLLEDPNKGINNTHGENGVLSRLFRVILKSRRIGPEKFGGLMADYLRDPRNKVANNRKKMQSDRGNLGLSLAQPKMTWKVFCRGLRFFKIWKIDIAIRAYYTDNSTDIYETTMVLAEHPAAIAARQEQTPQTTSRENADEDARDGTDE